MKFQIASDIHLEILETDGSFNENDDETFRFLIEPDSPILVLAGDITSPEAKVTPRFLEWCSKHFEHTLWIMGNHEYYNKANMPMEYILEKYRSMCPSNVHILDNETYQMDDVLFVGSTLWSNIQEEDELEIQNRINDYRMIYNAKGSRISPREISAKFHQNLKFIQSAVNNNQDKKIVIVTHHACLNKNTSYPGYEGEVANTAYATHIDLENDAPVKYWICGHTHHNYRIQKGSYTTVSNQMGYFGEHTGITYVFSGILEV